MGNSSGQQSGVAQAAEFATDVATVCCKGAENGLGHPAVYLTFSDQDSVQCYYCGSKFTRAAHQGQDSANT